MRMVPICVPSGSKTQMPPRPVQKTLPFEIDLHAVGDARRVIAAHVREDAPPEHFAVLVDVDCVDVFRRPRVGDVERLFVGREGEPVRVLDSHDGGNRSVLGDAIDGGAGPDAIDAIGPRDLALGKRPAHRRVGEPDAAVGMADHIVRTVEAAAFEALGQLDHLAVMLRPGDASVLALAVDQASLQVEGQPVAADGVAHLHRLLAQLHPVERARPDVVEIEKAVRVPQRPFGEDEAGRFADGLGGLENVGQVVHGHGVASWIVGMRCWMIVVPSVGPGSRFCEIGGEHW